jgi:hexokinase
MEMIYEALRAVDGIGEGGTKRIRIGIAKDGSGVGAALIALVAARMEKATDLAGIDDLRSKTTIEDENNERAISESE